MLFLSTESWEGGKIQKKGKGTLIDGEEHGKKVLLWRKVPLFKTRKHKKKLNTRAQ